VRVFKVFVKIKKILVIFVFFDVLGIKKLKGYE